MTRIPAALLLSAIFTLTCLSASALGPESLTEIDPYPSGSNEFSCANYSREEWKVTVENGKIQIGTSAYRDSTSLEIAGGNLVARNKGEFGGGLEFIKGKEIQ